MDTLIRCSKCGLAFSQSEASWACNCGGVLDVLHPAEFPLEKIKRRTPTMWRYREAIPIADDSNIVSFNEGFTPISSLRTEKRSVLLKLDFLFPTGSFKDRGSSVLLSRIKELGVRSVVEDSSGNAGASIAAYCAMASVECRIYVAENTSESKLAQIKAFGAELHIVPGTREDASERASDDARTLYYASHCWNPFFLQGTKTVAYEIAEQLEWKTPEVLIVPVGNGTLLLGAYIGFTDLYLAGLSSKIPKIIGVQSENCAPLFHMQRNNQTLSEGPASETVAEGIAVRKPIRAEQILDAVKITGGWFTTTSETDIEEAATYLARRGYLVEPTAAVAMAGFARNKSRLLQEESVVIILTGSGLKDTKNLSKLFTHQ